LTCLDNVPTERKLVIDLPGMTERCQELGYRCFEQDAGVDRWDLEDGAVDVVVSNQCLEHIPDTDHFIGEARRVLKKNGSLLLSVPNQGALGYIILLLLTINPPMNFVSDRYYGLGNPLSNIRWLKRYGPSRAHLRLFATRAMNDLLTVYGFRVVKNHGGSWGTPFLGRTLAAIMPYYGLYTIALAQKIAGSEPSA
jgi:SAM-dependent methyltransferase